MAKPVLTSAVEFPLGLNGTNSHSCSAGMKRSSSNGNGGSPNGVSSRSGRVQVQGELVGRVRPFSGSWSESAQAVADLRIGRGDEVTSARLVFEGDLVERAKQLAPHQAIIVFGTLIGRYEIDATGRRVSIAPATIKVREIVTKLPASLTR